jgi:membrane protein YdbS with pleckstrin-like domain
VTPDAPRAAALRHDGPAEGDRSASPGWRRPDPALLRLRRLLATVTVAVPATLAGLVLGLAGAGRAALLVLVAGALVLAATLAAVQRRWRAWGWCEREDDLLVRRGVLVRRTTVVPYGRMQFVDVVSGPLERRFGLATLTLHTAAVHARTSVPGLPLSEATRLRDHLAALGEARQAGV